jgi:PEP-CTERM motif
LRFWFPWARARRKLTCSTTLSEGSTVVATWTLPSTPNTASCQNYTPSGGTSPLTPCFESGLFFGVDTTVYMGGTTPVPDTIIFMPTSATTSPYVLLNDTADFLPDVDTLESLTVGSPLYTEGSCGVPEECPILNTGTFLLYNDAGQQVFTLSVSEVVSEVPEPSTIWMIGLGLMSVVCLARRRRVANWMLGLLAAVS